ncbi:hypothetical protein JCM13304A_05050 [Desulfothermus okinawensis JCM 13304]
MKKYIVICLLEVVVTIILCFFITWMNVTEISIKYEVSKLRLEYRKKKELHDKLETEASVLFSPYGLREIAKKLNLENIDPSRVRKIK